MYILFGLEKRGSICKIGTGFGGTVAGKVYITSRPKKDGGCGCWVYLKGKLYLRRETYQLETISVYNAHDLRYEGDISLDLLDFFKPGDQFN